MTKFGPKSNKVAYVAPTGVSTTFPTLGVDPSTSLVKVEPEWIFASILLPSPPAKTPYCLS